MVESAQGITIGLQLAGFVGNHKEELKQKNKAEWILDLPDLVELRTVTSDPTFLVLRDTYYPGWRAFVDGHEVHIWRTDYLFRGVEVPAGEHTIRFEFSPLSFRVGLVISIISFLLVLNFSTVSLNASISGLYWSSFEKRKTDLSLNFGVLCTK